MAREVRFTGSGWEDYVWWQENDSQALKKLNKIIQATLREPADGLGAPHALKGELAGYWSRSINKKDRLVYAHDAVSVTIVSCRFHYDDH
jgi:toxin YoeB